MSDFENPQPAQPQPPAQPAQSIPAAPSYDQGAPQPQYQQAPDPQAQAAPTYQQPVVNPAQPIMPTQATAPPEPKGFSGMFQDPATLAATGLLFAVLFAVIAGLINVLDGTTALDAQGRFMALTDTVDSGDVALVGIAVALLLVTPDPPGGIPRSLLLQFSAVISGVIAVFGIIRSLVLLVDGNASSLLRGSGFLATLGVATAAATVSFYAAKESFRKEDLDEVAA
jgi:hypothetical protein